LSSARVRTAWVMRPDTWTPGMLSAFASTIFCLSRSLAWRCFIGSLLPAYGCDARAWLQSPRQGCLSLNLESFRERACSGLPEIKLYGIVYKRLTQIRTPRQESPSCLKFVGGNTMHKFFLHSSCCLCRLRAALRLKAARTKRRRRLARPTHSAFAPS
jgi:hypothetical protein